MDMPWTCYGVAMEATQILWRCCIIVWTSRNARYPWINACLSNPDLIVVNALDLLRSKNLNSSPSKQKLPLTYEQVKNIIQDFREKNNINSTLSISGPSLMKAIDGALFRRCYNTYGLIYKNKFITNSYGKNIVLLSTNTAS